MVEYPRKTRKLDNLLWSSEQSEIIAIGIMEFIVEVFREHKDKKEILKRIKLYGFSMGVFVVSDLCKLLEDCYGKPEMAHGMLIVFKLKKIKIYK